MVDVSSKPEAIETSGTKPTWGQRFGAATRRPEFGALVAAILVYALFAVSAFDNNFVSIGATAGWLDVAALLAIIAIPVGMLMIAGEFDLSIGSVVGAASLIIAIGTSKFDVSIWIMIPIALAFGMGVGFINGFITVKTKLPSFIVTLAANFMVFGAAQGLGRLLSNSTTMSVATTPESKLVFASKIGQFSVAILWAVAVAIIGSWILNRTVFGNWIFATGGNPDAARAAGVPTDRVKVRLFAGVGFAAALVGVIQSIQFNTGSAINGQGYIFQAPVVAVIGGVLLTGGYGSVVGVFLGALIFGIISIGVFYTGWPTDWVSLFLGGLLLLAVLGNNYFRSLAMRRA